MKKVSLGAAGKFVKEGCVTYEYPLGLKNIDACFAKIVGRSPHAGFEYNTECHEVVFIISGGGELVTARETIKFCKGDVLVIEPMEKYFWGAACDCEMFISCNPPWEAEKHKYIEN